MLVFPLRPLRLCETKRCLLRWKNPLSQRRGGRKGKTSAGSPRIALIVLGERLEQSGLWIRRDVPGIQPEAQRRVRNIAGKRARLCAGGILSQPIAAIVVRMGGVVLSPKPGSAVK